MPIATLLPGLASVKVAAALFVEPAILMPVPNTMLRGKT